MGVDFNGSHISEFVSSDSGYMEDDQSLVGEKSVPRPEGELLISKQTC